MSGAIGRQNIPAEQHAKSLLWPSYRLAFLFAALSAIYLYVVIATPLEKNQFNKYAGTTGHSLAVTLVVYLPFILVWFVALGGYARLREYVRAIRKSADGSAFNMIAHGLFWITLWLPISAILAAVTTQYYRHNHQATALLVRASTYVNLIALLAAFALVYLGSRRLLRVARMPNSVPAIGLVIYVTFAALYCFLVFRDPARVVATHGHPVATYYLPDPIILATIVIPRLISWYLGLQAAYNIYVYQVSVSGKIYREALTSLSIGLAGVVTLTALFRSFQAVAAELNRLNMTMLLLVVYGLLACTSIGYLYIGKGAGKLVRFEKL